MLRHFEKYTQYIKIRLDCSSGAKLRSLILCSDPSGARAWWANGNLAALPVYLAKTSRNRPQVRRKLHAAQQLWTARRTSAGDSFPYGEPLSEYSRR
jgi:hypothetical protein